MYGMKVLISHTCCSTLICCSSAIFSNYGVKGVSGGVYPGKGEGVEGRTGIWVIQVLYVFVR